RPGEGAKSMLMLVNIFLLLVCYSVIKTVREPLILLGGGAEVRSYAAAGQALILIGFVPLYSWFANRVDRDGGSRARGLRRRRVLHLGRHLQRFAGRAVLVVRERHLQQRSRRTAVPDHRDRDDGGCAAG